jgi:hypothetical protein
VRIDDILTKDGIDTDFMSWLWKENRQTYTLIMFGHIELITQDLINKWEKKQRGKPNGKTRCY